MKAEVALGRARGAAGGPRPEVPAAASPGHGQPRRRGPAGRRAWGGAEVHSGV